MWIYESLHDRVTIICELVGRGTTVAQMNWLRGPCYAESPRLRAMGGVASGTTFKIRHWGSGKAAGDESFIVNRGWKWLFKNRQSNNS